MLLSLALQNHPAVVWSPHFTGESTFHCDPAIAITDAEDPIYEIGCNVLDVPLRHYEGALQPDGTRKFEIGYSLQTYHHHFADGRCPSVAAAPAPSPSGLLLPMEARTVPGRPHLILLKNEEAA